ncbi:MAG: hypothetical protein N2043_02185 [Ignavibacterium sp.]|nr:hypothetical protein [Ignavibacterium sp.]
MSSENSNNKDKYSWLEKTALVTAFIGGGVFAYKKGLLKPFLKQGIKTMGKYRQGKVEGFLKGIKKYTEDVDMQDVIRQQKNILERQKMIFYGIKQHVKESIEEIEKQRQKSKQAGYVNHKIPRVLQLINERNEFLNKLKKENLKEEQFEKMREVSNLVIQKSYNVDKKAEQDKIKRIGYRNATVKELMTHGKLNDEYKKVYEHLINQGKAIDKNFENKIADENIFFDEKTKEIIDIRDFRHSLGSFLNSMADDFTIPFVKINPIRMFYLKSFTTENQPPLFYYFKQNEIHPTITGNLKSLKNQEEKKEYAFMAGNLIEVDENGVVSVKMNRATLVESRSPWARLITIMSGRNETQNYKPRWDNRLGRAYYWVMKKLDIGFQDERVGGYGGFSAADASAEMMEKDFGFVWWDLTTYPGAVFHKIHNIIRPYDDKRAKHLPLHKRFIDEADSAPSEGKHKHYTVLSRYRPLKETTMEDWKSQFTATRNNVEDISTLGLTIYAFFERLNATLGQAGFALSSRHLGSTKDVAMGLLTHRLLPIWLGFESIDYFNYVGEKIFGEEPEDVAVEAFAKTQIGFAEIRDSLGLTDFFKRLGELTPGHEFLTDIAIPIPTTEGITPIKISDLFPLSSSAEELREYYEEGEEAVKKGRYWEFGNTPFVGGKIDYWQQNWLRRLTSDWQYSENLYGSKDEYWEHHALPTLSYPLAPIRHFFTDPYHWELKHYEDRPYPITGGVKELEEIPLVGPLLNSTLGELIKPTKYMHVDEWMTTNEEGEKEKPEELPTIFADSQFEYKLYRNLPEEVKIVYVPSNQLIQEIQIPNEILSQLEVVASPSENAKEENVKTYAIGSSELENIATLAGTENIDKKYFSYVTPSGMINVLKEEVITVEEAKKQVEEEKKSINHFKSKVDVLEPELPIIVGEEEDAISEDSLSMTLSDTFYYLGELGGFYGFSVNTIFGQPSPESPVIETADFMSYRKRFWDQDIGNLGGDINEIFRRMVPREQTMEQFNPIRNTMPEWLPGEDYYIDFQHGDPYAKIKKGELRLPGEAYEKVYDVDYRGDLSIPSQYVNSSPIEITKYWLHESNPEKMKYEERKKKRAERNLQEEGLKTEKGYVFHHPFYNVDVNVDFLINNETNKAKQAPVIVREVSDDVFQDLDEVREEEASELDIVTNQNNPYGYVYYINKDNPEEYKLLESKFNEQRLMKNYENISMAREIIKEKVESGEINRGDFYDPISRFRILSDVAPYSEEYQAIKEKIRSIEKTDEQQQELKEIRKQLQEKKDSYRLITPYKYKYADVDKQELTVKYVMDNGMIVTEEYPDNPIRPAGIVLPRGKKEQEQLKSFVEQYIQPGDKIVVGLDKNEAQRVQEDSYESMKAVIYAGPDDNLSETLINNQLAVENEKDNSAPSIVARFSWFERAIGSIWESFAHMDTPYHTKFLQARSALEQYERRDVYGQDWQTWEHPIRDFLLPAYYNLIEVDGPGEVMMGALGAGLVGMLFGTNKFGRLIGAGIGISTVLSGMLYTSTYESVTGEKWIPERRRQERELTEYMDALKYVKNRMLFDFYAQRSLEKENFNVYEYLKEKEKEGEELKKKKEELKYYKKQLKIADSKEVGKIIREVQEKYGATTTTREDTIKFINDMLNSLVESRKVEEIPELAAKALMYYNESEKTLYGYDIGEPLENFIQALPRTEREYFNHFLTAPEEEQDNILAVVPDYMKPVLESAWGREVTHEKKSLYEIFEKNELPDSSWEGWSPFINLNDVKVKIAKEKEMNLSNLNIFREDEKRADMLNIRTPKFHDVKQSEEQLHGRLLEIAKKLGIMNPTIELVPRYSGEYGYNIEANITQNRQKEIKEAINQYGYSAFE